MRRCHSVLLAAMVLITVLGLGLTPGLQGLMLAPVHSVQGWGSVKGQIVFAGDAIPEAIPYKMTKDQDHCMSKGPQKEVKWLVNSKNKGLANVVAFLQPERGKSLEVHDTLKSPAQKNVILDQPLCIFEPRIVAMRKDQSLLVKNPAPIAHNIVIDGFNNSYNVQMPPASEKSFTLEAGYLPNSLRCGAHEWMKGYLFVFEHPYFAVTDDNGQFEIKAGAETDLGKIEVKPN